MKFGAFDFFEKPFRSDLLIPSIRNAVFRDLKQREIRANYDRFRNNILALTERERQVLKLIVTGKTSKQIAREMEISTKTVHFHRINLMEKLRVESIARLVYLVVTTMGTELDKIQGAAAEKLMNSGENNLDIQNVLT
jgi:FixJ family two-component response regulator